MKKKKGLQLTSFSGVVQGATHRGDSNVPIGLIDVERQVRTQFDEEKQASINASIHAQGINQSLVLLAKPDGRYRLIAGEYRYRGALANNLTEVPARVRHNLDDWQIRRIQVSENLERTDISAFDEAVGVAEDVAKYGFATAKDIWNRSDGWISKRAAVLKYAEPVRQLLKEGICNDLEVGHSLNQVFELAKDEFTRLEKRLREGVALSREEARAKVQQMKEWANEVQQRQARRQVLDAGATKTSSATDKAAPPRSTPKPTTTEAAPARPLGTPMPAQDRNAPGTLAPTPETEGRSNSDGDATSPVVATTETITQEQALVLQQMVTVYEHGLANHTLVQDVQGELAELGADMNQTEWALWSLFQTAVLPLVGALGPHRAQRYIQRTINELRSAEALELWRKLHPAVDDTQSADWTAASDPVAPMPKDWRF